MSQPLLSKPACRIALTILMYAGVLLFLFPYLSGRVFTGVVFVITGAALAVVAGLARCFLTDGDCTERDSIKQRIP
jgi:hypothetical protein